MERAYEEYTYSMPTYYVLPLLKLNNKTFGHYYEDTKVYKSFDAIQVKIRHGCKEEYWKHKNYQIDYEQDGYIYIIFSIPDKFIDDVKLICKGKVSKISESAKSNIRKYSGLLYKEKVNTVLVTDKMILAMDRDVILKEWLEKKFKVRIGSRAELYYLPENQDIYVRD